MPHPSRFLPLLTLCCALAFIGCGGGGDTQRFATCGNDRIDSGERCDDGNIDDGDACTSACQPARCGDGVAYRSVEACDGRDMLTASCATFGMVGSLACAGDCTFDTTGCSAAPATSTPLPPTPSPTPSPTPRTDACGDGLLSPGETCDSCPDDCIPRACVSDGGEANVTVSIALPPDSDTTRVNFTLAYRTGTVSLPEPPTRRVTSLAPPLFLRGISGGGYSLEVTSGNGSIFSGPLAGILFDRCAGAPAPEMDDFACTVTLCRSGSVDLTGCTCVASP